MDKLYDHLLLSEKEISFEGSYHIMTEWSINEIKKIFPDTIFYHSLCQNIYLKDRNFVEHFQNNNIESVDILLNHCEYPDHTYLLGIAVLFSNENMINYLLSTGKNEKGKIYTSILRACARTDNSGVLSTILDHKFDSFTIDINYCHGLFMAQAVVSNNIPAIKILLEHGFDMESHGKMFIYLALRKKAYESFNYLVKDPDSFVYNLVDYYPLLVTNFIQYVNEYGIELHPESLQKLAQKN
jgi:hypothetical protein